ncbi:DUF6176 family protein [Arthrobacter sp. I2-34]|uniref:DUF6176 family protein n=1 Tax=Arthrobacter hankyongi TaxID=2904801 RepID=A0ABS9L8E4_9MICC|nr:DUF6176 family protein [Arthrobacter hankyongi]MCG2622896.1 DUF6176 family protein [Arthrobacter hankyongi]
MEAVTWFAPILDGKLEAWQAFTQELMGARQAEHVASRRRMGMVREVAGLMQTPAGDFVCLFHEAEDLDRAFAILAGSEDPYDVWFRAQITELHGITSDQLKRPPATVYLDYHQR